MQIQSTRYKKRKKIPVEKKNRKNNDDVDSGDPDTDSALLQGQKLVII